MRKAVATFAALTAVAAGATLPAQAGPVRSVPGFAVKTTLVEVVVVNAQNGNGVRTVEPLLAGHTYVFVASGLYNYEKNATSVADPECSTASGDSAFVPNRYGTGSSDRLDLFINTKELTWKPMTPGVQGCDPGHVYTLTGTPATSSRWLFQAYDPFADDNTGALTVAIYEVRCANPLSCLPVEPCDPTTSPTGCLPVDPPCDDPMSCVPPVDPPCDNPMSCVPPVDPPCDNPMSCVPPVDPPCDDPMSCVPPPGCDPFQNCLPPVEPPCDPSQDDCLPPPPPPPPVPTLPGAIDTFILDSRARDGRTSNVVLQAGTQYRIDIIGLYHADIVNPGGGFADAECVNVYTDPTFRRERYANNLFDVMVERSFVYWTPIQADDQGCDPSHSYYLLYTPSSTKTLQIGVYDAFYHYWNNAGGFVVAISKS